MDGRNEAAGIARLNTIVAAADAGEAGLIAKGRKPSSTHQRGWVYNGAGLWFSDRVAEAPVTLATLLANADSGSEITFTGVIAGMEYRLGVDRDEDGFSDRDELDAGSDPGDPNSTPASVSAPGLASPSAPGLHLLGRNPARDRTQVAFSVTRQGAAQLSVYDIRGRLVKTLFNEANHEVGDFETGWDLRNTHGSAVSNGVYFLRLSDLQGSAISRVVVLR